MIHVVEVAITSPDVHFDYFTECLNKINNILLFEMRDQREDINGLKEDVDGIKEDVDGIKEDVDGLKHEVGILKEKKASEGIC